MDFNIATFRHPWYWPGSPFTSFRSNPVLMVPKNLTLEQLSKIMLECSVNFRARFSSDTTGRTIKELHEKLCDDDETRERFNGILDLEYDVSQILKIQDSEDGVEGKKLHKEVKDEETQSGYVP